MEVTIRAMVEDDLEPLVELINDRKFLLGTMRLPHSSVEDVRKRFMPADGVYRLIGEVDGRLAGLIELETYPHTPRHAHAGDVHLIATMPEFRSQGVGRALMDAITDLADNWLDLRRLGLSVWVTNPDAIAFYESCGFEIEGTMRDYVFRDGEYVDALTMARIKR